MFRLLAASSRVESNATNTLAWGMVRPAWTYFGSPSSYQSPATLTCNNYGYSFPSTDKCGVNGIECLPPPTQRNLHSNWVPLRCPARCAWQDRTIWGTGIYRPDSHLCSAAHHAGTIDASGGCFLVRTTPGKNATEGFVGTAKNGLTSRSFPSWFPRGLEFRNLTQGVEQGQCGNSPVRPFACYACLNMYG